jgi:hypothetical protein
MKHERSDARASFWRCGVRFVVEELTKSVLQSGLLREETDRYVLERALPPFAIPMTLHDSLMSRLDRLAQHAPTVIVELARLALRAKSETARIAAIRELLDRGYGRPRPAMEVSVPADNPLQLLLDEIDARSRIEPPVSHTPDRNQLPRGLNGAE